MDQLVAEYFALGYTQKVTVTYLAEKHGIFITDRTVRRIWQKLNLTREKNYSDLNDVSNFIEDLLKGSGSICGYRWLYRKLILAGYTVRKEDVRLLLASLDPQGVATRQQRRFQRREYFASGPNFLWHIDGYDKLKPYGICIHGCIDGFSRYVLWLEAHCTNNNPKVIAGYYIETLKKKKICPFFVRGDCGNENVEVRNMQQFLHRLDDHEGVNSYLYGRSTANQRIESWWGQLRRHSIQFWMNALQGLKDVGEFTGDRLDKSIVQYCFMDLVQEDLNNVVKVWNLHDIRPSRNSNVPHGKPSVMYDCPISFGSHECGFAVTEDDLSVCSDKCVFRNGNPCTIEAVKDLCDVYMAENNWSKPSTCEEATDLYIKLKNMVIF